MSWKALKFTAAPSPLAASFELRILIVHFFSRFWSEGGVSAPRSFSPEMKAVVATAAKPLTWWALRCVVETCEPSQKPVA